MKILFLVYGKTTDSRLEALTQEYVGRIVHYAPFKVVVIPCIRNAKNVSERRQKELERDLLKGYIHEGDYIVLLDERGTELRSVDFAQWMEKRMGSQARRLVFVSGGPYGFDPEVYNMAQEKLSLSRMTFSHQMIRLLFTEQVYRALTILKGDPYHHE